MGLREIAKADNLFITSGDAQGFRWALEVTDPAGLVMAGPANPLYGISNDVYQVIDPDTGMAVSGRNAAVSIHMQTLLDFFSGKLPVNIVDADLKPWLVKFLDINGAAHTFKVQDSQPDRTLGMITLMLGIWDI